MTNQERIDNYLNGNMPPEEERQLMANSCLHPALNYMLTIAGLKYLSAQY